MAQIADNVNLLQDYTILKTFNIFMMCQIVTETEILGREPDYTKYTFLHSVNLRQQSQTLPSI